MELIELTATNIQMYLADCLALQAQLVSDPSHIRADLFLRTAEDSQSYFLGVLEAGHIIGIGVVSRVVEPVHIVSVINNIVVDETYRGKGLFATIMTTLEQMAQAWGCTQLVLTCSRPPVQALYEKRGYKKRETNYYILAIPHV